MFTKRERTEHGEVRVVGVIGSREDLRLALRSPNPPDFFELRLDLMPDLALSKTAALPRPLIITVRHAAEGGAGKLSPKRRRDLFMRFMPQATWVDLELRSRHDLDDVWEEARRRSLGRICSVHYLRDTPTLRTLHRDVQRARSSGANIVKLVARADTPGSWLSLLDLLIWGNESGLISVMATGRFGPLSRQVFPACGSALVYVAMRVPRLAGQLTLAELRQTIARRREDGILRGLGRV